MYIEAPITFITPSTYSLPMIGIHSPEVGIIYETGTMTHSALHALLLYLYSGKLDHIVNPFDCLYILSVSDYYELITDHLALLIHCSYTVRNSITVENCLGIFQLAHRLNVIRIKEKSLGFIFSHYTEVSKYLTSVPIDIFMEINVAFNLKMIQKYGPLQ